MGHVNNAVYSTYLEQARIGILGDLEPFILARVEIDFRAELRAGEQVEVRSRCARVGGREEREDSAHHPPGARAPPRGGGGRGGWPGLPPPPPARVGPFDRE